MRLEKCIGGEWRNAGPYVSGAHTVELMGEMVRVYQWIAQLIEDRYRHPEINRIEDGCPVCGAKNPRMVLVGDGFDLECGGCADRAKRAGYKFPVFGKGGE